jgi:hypothetical protein
LPHEIEKINSSPANGAASGHVAAAAAVMAMVMVTKNEDFCSSLV